MGIKRLLYRFDLRITGASIRTMFVQFGAHILLLLVTSATLVVTSALLLVTKKLLELKLK